MVITPCRRVEGSIEVPGDKSIAHRALCVAMINEGPFALRGLPAGADVRSTLGGLRRLSLNQALAQVEIELSQSSTLPRDFQVVGESAGIDEFRAPYEPVDAGNSGTTIRMLSGILAGSQVEAILTGDESIRRRPMARVVDPLRLMGAQIEYLEEEGLAPFRVTGTELTGKEHRLAIASAQVKSALLLAGLRASGRTTVIEPHASRDHTERMLRYLGAPLDKSIDGCSVISTKLSGDCAIDVPGDMSSAAYLLVAAAILPGSRVQVRDVGLNPTRTGILDILRAYGASVTVEDETERCGELVGSVTVEAGDRRPVEVSGELTVSAVDELPLVAVLGTFAEGTTTVADAAELRVKESDRIQAIADVVTALGGAITPRPDGFVVEGRGGTGTAGARVDAHGDHRIAMAAAVAGLAAREGDTSIHGWSAVDISYPGFGDDLRSVVVP